MSESIEHIQNRIWGDLLHNRDSVKKATTKATEADFENNEVKQMENDEWSEMETLETH